MKTLHYTYHDQAITFFGRTVEDLVEEVTFFDWTCSGFQFCFEASKVEVEIKTLLVEENNQVLYPFLAVFLDNSEEPYKIIKLEEPEGIYTLFESNQIEAHCIRVVKRTEAQHSKTGLKSIKVEGGCPIRPWPIEAQLYMEFIGDSITCGYGNETNRPEDGFKTEQENGWAAYAAKTARKLSAHFHCVSVSGIGVYSSWTGEDKMNDLEVMPKVYGYADYYLDKALGKTNPTEWVFANYVPDIIVINLGTNDYSYIKYEPQIRKQAFKSEYIAFLKQVREKNGVHPKIICCLGVMEGELNSALLEAVQAYTEDTKDKDIHTFTFDKQLEEDGIGGSFHPTVRTHEKMADKLVQEIQKWIQ